MPRASRQECTDEELARAVTDRGAGSQDAFRVLYERYRWRLLGFLKGLGVGEALDDVHQDVWLRIWQHLPAKFGGQNFRAWLFQIARNRVVDLGRVKKQPATGEELSGRADPRPLGPVEVLIGRELGEAELDRARRLEECLRELEQQNADGAALVRGRLGGQGYDELCERLRLARQRAQRLFHTLKEQLQRCVGKGEV